MRSVMQDLVAPFDSFVADGHYLLLISACSPENSALLLKGLEAVEEAPESQDIYLTFGHDFLTTESYIEQTLGLVRLQHEQVNGELEKRGKPLLPSFPENLAPEDGRLPCREDLRDLILYLREIVPPDRKLVCLFFPLRIADGHGFFGLFEYLLKDLKNFEKQGVRLIVRDDVDKPALVALDERANVIVHQPQLDPDSIEAKLNQKANDPSVPVEEQAQLHMMLTGLDVASRRYRQATDRNLELLAFFEGTGQQHQQSVVANNLGDLNYMQKRFPEAEQWYRHALDLSLTLDSQPLVLYQSVNLGNALLSQGKPDAALACYRAAEKLARASHTPTQHIEALQKVASACEGRRDWNAAVDSWSQAADLSRQMELTVFLKSSLEGLSRCCSRIGDRETASRCRHELRELESSGGED